MTVKIIKCRASRYYVYFLLCIDDYVCVVMKKYDRTIE